MGSSGATYQKKVVYVPESVTECPDDIIYKIRESRDYNLMHTRSEGTFKEAMPMKILVIES